MRRSILAGCVALAVHLAAVVLVGPYLDFVETVGGWFVHATDIADIPETLFVGAAVVGAALVLAAAGLAYWVPIVRRHVDGGQEGE